MGVGEGVGGESTHADGSTSWSGMRDEAVRLSQRMRELDSMQAGLLKEGLSQGCVLDSVAERAADGAGGAGEAGVAGGAGGAVGASDACRDVGYGGDEGDYVSAGGEGGGTTIRATTTRRYL